MSDAADDIAGSFGARLREHRDKAGMTLDELAKRSGVSRAMLSTVERGEKSPTIGLATRIAHALETTLSSLLGTGGPGSSVAVVREGERSVFRDPVTGFERHVVSPALGGARVELLCHYLPPWISTGPLPAYPHGTEKQVLVTQGNLVVILHGVEHMLGSGDALFFEADVEHAFENRTEHPCAYVLVVSRRL